MFRRLLKPILILPGTVLVFVPVLIIFTTHNTSFRLALMGLDSLLFWPALIAAVIGLGLTFWTVTLFTTFDKGTPAP
jgi:hypothetical protein